MARCKCGAGVYGRSRTCGVCWAKFMARRTAAIDQAVEEIGPMHLNLTAIQKRVKQLENAAKKAERQAAAND